MTITYGSVCSGIEAATVAWHPLGWQAAWLSEIEPFPNAVLAHHYPDVPNLGDMTTIADRVKSGEVASPQILTGGTPCQAFSINGLRKGLNDERGRLSLAFCQLADAIDNARLARDERPSVIIWENVPGVLSDKGNAFGCFLAALVGEDDPLIPPGGRWTHAGCVLGPQRTVAWRVLNAQYFGVPQRRRRVWVVASAGGIDPCHVLFESNNVQRDSAPSRGVREEAARDCGGVTKVADDTPLTSPRSGNVDTHRSGHFVCPTGDITHTLTTCTNPRYGTSGGPPIIVYPDSPQDMRVRRLTPVEYERLQGFPDGYTAVPWRNKPAEECPDTRRYHALGNSWAVPCAAWIGKRVNDAIEHGVASQEGKHQQ